MLGDRVRNEVLARDLDLLVLGIAGDEDDLHAVHQGRGDIERVCRGDEHHVREIVVDLEVMVVEGVVLLGVEHFEQRRRRVAAEIRAHLVDLVEQEQRVRSFGLAHPLNDPARHGADIGAPVAADLGLIVHAAEREAHEVAARPSTPPSEKRPKSGPVALAIDLPSEVLPTPAGPTRHRIGPVSLLARCCTARYSTIRSLTFSRPKWSLSRTSWASLRSFLILERLAHGIDRSQSRELRTTVDSADIGDICRSFLSSWVAFSRASFESVVFLILSSISASSSLPSSSPSSFWIAFICS